MHPEWIVTALSTMLQREQMKAISLAVQRPSFQRAAGDLDGLRTQELLHAAEQLGEFASVRDALRMQPCGFMYLCTRFYFSLP